MTVSFRGWEERLRNRSRCKPHRQSACGIDRHDDDQLLLDRVAVMFENRIALTVSCAVSILLADRQRRRGPEDAEVVVANVNRGAGRIGDRIVEPRREAIALAITVPGESRARLGDERAEVRIRHDVDPGSGSLLAGTEIDRVFFSILE